MPIARGNIIVAQEVIDRLRSSLVDLRAAARNPYDVIFNKDNNDKENESNLWYGIRIPQENVEGISPAVTYNQLSANFLSSITARINNIRNIGKKLLLYCGYPTDLSGFRNTVLSCYAYASNVRDTFINYVDFTNNYLYEEVRKNNNAFLTSAAIESRTPTGRQLAGDNMFHNNTATPSAAVAYDDVSKYIDLLSNYHDPGGRFDFNNVSVLDSRYKFATNYSDVTDDNPATPPIGSNVGMFFDFDCSRDAKSTESKPFPTSSLKGPMAIKPPGEEYETSAHTLLYTQKIMYAKDVLDCADYMDDVTEYIRNYLSCLYGPFTNEIGNLSLYYVPMSGYVRKVAPSPTPAASSLTADKNYFVRLNTTKFRLVNSLTAIPNEYFYYNKAALSNYFAGWTADPIIRSDPYTDIDKLESFWPYDQSASINLDNPSSISNKQLRNFRDRIVPIGNGQALSVYPVYFASYIMHCYYGAWYGDFDVSRLYENLRISTHTYGKFKYHTEPRVLNNTYNTALRYESDALMPDINSYINITSSYINNHHQIAIPSAAFQNSFINVSKRYKSAANNNYLRAFVNYLNEANNTPRSLLAYSKLSNDLINYSYTADTLQFNSYINLYKGHVALVGTFIDRNTNKGTSQDPQYPQYIVSTTLGAKINGVGYWDTKEVMIRSWDDDKVNCPPPAAKTYNGANGTNSRGKMMNKKIGSSDENWCYDGNCLYTYDRPADGNYVAYPQKLANDILSTDYCCGTRLHNKIDWAPGTVADIYPSKRIKHVPLKFNSGAGNFTFALDVEKIAGNNFDEHWKNWPSPVLYDFWTRNPNVVVFWPPGNNRFNGTGPYYDGGNAGAWEENRSKDMVGAGYHYYPADIVIANYREGSNPKATHMFNDLYSYNAYTKYTEWGCFIEGLIFKIFEFTRTGT